jgi:hypothetical protein
MEEQGWIPSEIMMEHLQDLMVQGFMMAPELATCRMPEDSTSPMPVGVGVDWWWPMWHSTSEGLVCHHNGYSALYCSSMVWNYTI